MTDPRVSRPERYGRGKSIHLHELLAVLRCLPSEWWMALLLMRLCGLRCREAFEVEVDHIDLDSSSIFVSGRGSVVPVPPMLLPFIAWWIANRVADAATGAINGSAILAWPNRQTFGGAFARLRHHWRKAVLAAGLTNAEDGGPYRDLHILRSSLAYDLSHDDRIPQWATEEILGHSSKGRGPITSRRFRVANEITEAERIVAGAWGVIIGDATLRNSEMGDIVPALMERLRDVSADGRRPSHARLGRGRRGQPRCRSGGR